MAVALGQNDQQLGEILAALTAPDTTRIKQAEDALKPVLKRPESVGLLTTQVSRSENPAVRQIAAVILRKKIGKLWKKVKKNARERTKGLLLERLASEPERAVPQKSVAALASAWPKYYSRQTSGPSSSSSSRSAPRMRTGTIGSWLTYYLFSCRKP